MDERVPERRDSHASSSVDLGKHRINTHFPKDRKGPHAEDAMAESYLVQNFLMM